MKRVSIFLSVFALMLGMAQSAHAQGRPGGPPPGQGGMLQGQISGSVADAESGDPIPTATVAVWSVADSSLATGTVAGDDGSFLIEGIRPGRYYVKVSFIGYATETVDGIAITPQSLRADLGTIDLRVETAILDEVQVSAERDFMEVHIDKNVYNTKDQLVSEGGSATDVLRNIPSLEVDMEGKLSLRGNQNVAVLINGRPSQMNADMLASFLQGLPASSIERVEVIPNPSARYEPDGMSGIVNIVLKQKSDLGLSGALTAGVGTQEDYNASGMLGYSKGKLGARINYGFRTGNRERSGERFNEYRFESPFEYLETISEGENGNLSHTLNGNLDYQLSRRNTLSLSGLLSMRNGDGNNLNAYTEWSQGAEDNLLTYNRLNTDNDEDFNVDLGATYRYVVEPLKHELVAELRYENEREDEDEEYRQELIQPGVDPVLMELERSFLGNRNTSTALQIDYIRPLGKEGKIEVGYKGTLQELDSDIVNELFDTETGEFVPDTDFSNTFTFEEQVHSGYGIIGQQFGKLGAQAGVRVEQALTTFSLTALNESFDNNYFSAFPSAFLTYKFNDLHMVRASYSKRINRPRVGGRFNMLNPISDRSDPLFRRVGNPYLKPEYVHSAELTYTLNTKWAMFSISPYYRRTVDVIRFIDEVDENGVTTVTFKNLDMTESWGGQAILTARLGDRLNGFASFDLYRVATDAASVSDALSNNAYGWATRINGTIKLTPTLSMQASWFYRAPMNVEQGRMGAMTRSDIALRQQLFGNKASLSLRVSDPLNMSGFHIMRDTPTFYFENENRWNARAMNVTFTYNFGRQDRNTPRRQGPPREDQGGPAGDYPDMGM